MVCHDVLPSRSITARLWERRSGLCCRDGNRGHNHRRRHPPPNIMAGDIRLPRSSLWKLFTDLCVFLQCLYPSRCRCRQRLELPAVTDEELFLQPARSPGILGCCMNSSLELLIPTRASISFCHAVPSLAAGLEIPDYLGCTTARLSSHHVRSRVAHSLPQDEQHPQEATFLQTSALG